ncbi:MAG: cytochrome P450 [Elainellaceae cyanobacterium]
MVTTKSQTQTQTPSLKPLPAPLKLQPYRWTTQPIDYLEAAAKQYGDLFTIQTPYYKEPIVVISHPQAMQEVFTAPSDYFDVGYTNAVLEPYLGKHSLLLLDGESHQTHRKLLMPPLHGEQMRSYGGIICDTTLRISREWKAKHPLVVYPFMQEVSSRVILQVVFGLEANQHEELQQLILSFLNTATSPLGAALMFFMQLRRDFGPWSPWGRIVRQRQRMEALLITEIEQRRQCDDSRNDVLSLLLTAQDEAGQSLTNQEICDELLTLLFAGNDTLTTSLSWGFYWIHRDPDVLEKLLAELVTLGENPDPIAISRLPYLSAVCSEILRFYPPSFVTSRRIVKKPIALMGYQLEPGMQIFPCIYLTHHRPEIYPDPKQFKPERFLEQQFSPYEFLPFGGGNRRCIGHAFAQFEMKLVIATMLSHYSLKLTSNRPLKPQRRGFLVPPAGGVRMNITERKLQTGDRSTESTTTASTAQTTSGCPFKRYFAAKGQ